MKRLCGLVAVSACLVLSACSTTSVSYRTSIGNGADEIPVVVVSGTPYEMGYAFGRLMKDETKQCMKAWLTAARRADPKNCSDAALDAAWKAVAPHTHERFKQELRGVAEGSGVPYESIVRTHMVPVVGSYSCSGVACWGSATKDGHLLQIRNLDFTVGAGLEDCPAIVIYRPENGIPHASVTVAGCIGANTGMNAEGVVLGEKGESPSKERPYDLNGIHFLALFRDVLNDARDLGQAVDMIRSAKLIKRYYFYVGASKGGKQGAVKIKVTTPDTVPLHVWHDDDKADELAPRVLKDVIYNTMNNKLAYAYLKENGGEIDSAKMIELSKRLASRNGNLLNAIYDADTLEMWVAYAEGRQHAFDRAYVHVKMKDYLDSRKVPDGAVVLDSAK